MAGGRPSMYSKEVCDKICILLATSSMSIHNICKLNEDLPSYETVFKWLNDPEKKAFVDQYAHAREAQADFIVDEIIEIADDVLEAKITKNVSHEIKGDSTEETTGDNVARSRLMMDARKWKASKLAPKKYGDKLDLNHTNNGESFNLGNAVSGFMGKENKDESK